MHAAFMKLGLCVLISNIVKIDILQTKNWDKVEKLFRTRLRDYWSYSMM